MARRSGCGGGGDAGHCCANPFCREPLDNPLMEFCETKRHCQLFRNLICSFDNQRPAATAAQAAVSVTTAAAAAAASLPRTARSSAHPSRVNLAKTLKRKAAAVSNEHPGADAKRHEQRVARPQTQEAVATDSQQRSSGAAPSTPWRAGRLRMTDSDEDTAAPAVNIDDLPIPKKRWRPRKVDAAEAKRPVQISEESKEPPQKQRIGRPRKTENTPPPTPAPSPPPSPAPVVEQTPVVKKRGRPRKVVANTAGDVAAVSAALDTLPTTPSSLARTTSGIDLVPLGPRSRPMSMSGGRYVASGNRTAAHALPPTVPTVRPTRLTQFQGAQSVPATSVVNVAKSIPRKAAPSASNAAVQPPTKPMHAQALTVTAAAAIATHQQPIQSVAPRTSTSIPIVTPRNTLPIAPYSAPASPSAEAAVSVATQVSSSSAPRPSMPQTTITRSTDPRQANGIRTISASDYLRSNRSAGECTRNPSVPLYISPPTSPSPAAVIPQWSFEQKKPATFLRSPDLNPGCQPYDIEAGLKGRRRIHLPLPRPPEPIERSRSDDSFSSSSRASHPPTERQTQPRADNPFSSLSRAPHAPVERNRPPPQTGGWSDSRDSYSSRDRSIASEDNNSFDYEHEEKHSRHSWNDAQEPPPQSWGPSPREESRRPYSYESSPAPYRESPRTSPPVQESYRERPRQSFLPPQDTRSERSSEQPEDSYPCFSSHDPLMERLISRMASYLPTALLPVLNKTKKARKMRFYVDYVNRVEVICGKDVVKVKIESTRGTVLVSGREWLVVHGSSSVDVYTQILEQLLDDSQTWRKLIEDAKRVFSNARKTIGSHADPGISFNRLWDGIKRKSRECSLERQVIYFCGDQRHHWSFVIGKVEIGSGSDVDRKRAYNMAAYDAMMFLTRLRILSSDEKYGSRERELDRRSANEEYARRPRVDDFGRSEIPPRPRDREESEPRPTQIPAAPAPPVSIVHTESWTSPDAAFSPIVRSDPSEDMSISESESVEVPQTVATGTSTDTTSSACMSCAMLRIRKPGAKLCQMCESKQIQPPEAVPII